MKKKLLMASAVLALIGGITAFLLLRQDNSSNKQAASDAADPLVFQDQTKPSQQEPVQPVKLITYTPPDGSLSIQIPETWKPTQNPDSGTNIDASTQEYYVGIFLYANTASTTNCTTVGENSRTLAYTNPTSIQRKETYITPVVLSDDLVCGYIITGAKSYVKGDRIQPGDTLPSNRIMINVAKAENQTLFPKQSDFEQSQVYQQLLAALQSIQIKK